MKLIYPLCAMALLLSANGCASTHVASEVDKKYTRYIDNYINQFDKPFPSELNYTITLGAIRREGQDVFITLNSTNNFEYVGLVGIDYMSAADMLSESFVYQLDFLYNTNHTGVCQSSEFKPAKGRIQINYDFLDIQYKTQITKTLGEICGWENSDGKTYANNTELRVANRNLFAAYAAILVRAIGPYIKAQFPYHQLSFSLDDNETLLYTYRQGKVLTEEEEQKLTEALFPSIMCRFTDQFRLVDVKVKNIIIDENDKVVKTQTQDSRSFCALPVKNIFNLK